MYLEQRAEFYTWDRPATYSLSLEELFRHEFNHYLQGRFLIPGFWGVNPFYENNRLTWYEEGHAEFLCASSDYEGIKLKQSTVNRMKYDYPGWPSLSDVLTSYYGQAGSIYYPYGNLVWFNWYKNDYGKIKLFNDLTRSNNIVGFDSVVNVLKNSPAAQAQWQSFLTDVYNDIIPAWQINTNWTNDQNLVIALLNDIHDEFTAITTMTNVTVTGEATSLIARFRISGTITGSGTATNNTEVAISVNLALDTLLTLLYNDPYINNFDYIVGYVTDITHPGNVPTANFHILGSLRDPAVPENPAADFTADHRIALTGNPVNFISLSHGYIKGYTWSFSGGSPPVSSGLNPSVTYNSAGEYPVSLTVTGKAPSITDTKTVENYIKVYAPSTTSYCSASHAYDYAWISRVKLKDIDNTTNGFPPSGYSDFSSAFLTELDRNVAYPIFVDLSYTNSPSMGIAMWIDLNNNGSFTDQGEQLLLAHPPQLSQLSGATITIPADATTGVTRMRIRATYNGGAISPCGADGYMGEVEDYTVVIGTPTNTQATGTTTGTACYNATQTISVAANGNSFIVPDGGNVTMIAGHNILYYPGTAVHLGGYLWGMVAPAGPYCVTPAILMPPAVIGKLRNPAGSVSTLFKIYPNPTAGNFTVELTAPGEAE